MRPLGVTYNQFDVVVVPFPFTDRPAIKKRPALVVSANNFNTSHHQLILAMITTAKQSDWPSDVPVNDWTEAGLSTSCYVRFKLFTLDRNLIIRGIGSLSKNDKAATRIALKNFLSIN
jgi:mRNA interferase MazF